MSKLIIIRGYSATGKSTVSKILAEKYDYALIREDTFFFALNPHQPHEKDDYEVTFDNILDCLKNYMEIKKGIILEGALVAAGDNYAIDLNKIISLAKKYNYQVARFILTADEDTCKKRMRERKCIVKNSVYDKLKDEINRTKSEDEIVIDTSQSSIEEIFKKIESYL